jgi:hypothetical protein
MLVDELSDADLVVLARSGDAEAFRVLLRPRRGDVPGVGLSHT